MSVIHVNWNLFWISAISRCMLDIFEIGAYHCLCEIQGIILIHKLFEKFPCREMKYRRNLQFTRKIAITYFLSFSEKKLQHPPNFCHAWWRHDGTTARELIHSDVLEFEQFEIWNLKAEPRLIKYSTPVRLEPGTFCMVGRRSTDCSIRTSICQLFSCISMRTGSSRERAFQSRWTIRMPT